MIDQIIKKNNSLESSYPMTILIPSWNNLDILQFCIKSIKKNSHFNLQIIVVINEGIDGTKQWVEQQTELDYVYSPENIGICYALNACRSMVKSDYIVYLNDDMYVLPNWDLSLHQAIEKENSKAFFISGTMIEPHDTGNACVVVKDYGENISDFKEEAILNDYESLKRDDWMGSTWPPNVMHVELWDLVGGYSIEFSPGMYSDPDLSKKLFEAGVRNFKGVGSSLVYHFGSKSTRRVRKNTGKKMFLLKWGITPRTFTKNYLTSGSPYRGSIQNITLSKTSKFINRIKRIKSC
jgi:glycosyltransferase involved in cell wall biosynthesis